MNRPVCLTPDELAVFEKLANGIELRPFERAHAIKYEGSLLSWTAGGSFRLNAAGVAVLDLHRYRRRRAMFGPTPPAAVNGSAP